MKNTRSAQVLLSAVVTVFAVALAGCSSDEEAAPPQATGGPDAGQTPGGSEVPPADASPSVAPDADDEAPAAPAGTGLVLATELDTNAPVDPSALGGTLTPSQVQEMRRVWNERSIVLEGVDEKTSPCVANEAGVWSRGVTAQGGVVLFVLGAGSEGATITCALDEAAVVVDAETLEVLGDQDVALLL